MMELLKREKRLRGIPTDIHVEFFKKARGTLLGTGVASLEVRYFVMPCVILSICYLH